MLQLAFLGNRYSFYISDVIIAGAWTRTCIENNFCNVGWLGVCVCVWEGGGGEMGFRQVDESANSTRHSYRKLMRQWLLC